MGGGVFVGGPDIQHQQLASGRLLQHGLAIDAREFAAVRHQARQRDLQLDEALFGLVPIRSGTVSLRGEDITNMRADQLVTRGIGFVPQTNNVFPSLTIEENLEMGSFQDHKRFRENFDRVVDIFPVLGDRRSQRAGSLSGGERQMVAMGRALMMNPQVLLLDEPSAGLSPARQDETFVRTREINRTGVTVIMVEQNARRCLQICDRGYVLDQGTSAYTATGQELLKDPKVIELYLGTLGA